MTCGSCHKNMATDGAATGSHVKHANTTTGMAVPCGYCHQDAGSGFFTMHADRSVFINFTSYIGGAYSVGTPYLTGVQKVSQSAAFGSCVTTFCHGTAESPAWGTVGTLACNACHSAKVDDASWSGNHKIHYNYSTMPTSYTQTVQDLSNVNRYRFNCAHCHDDNVSKHSLKPQSADSAARVFFGISTATPVTSSRRGTYSYGSPQGSTDNGFNFTNGVCNASYCHSNGRGGAPFSPSLTWTTAKAPGTNCTLCHDTSSKTVTATQLSGKHDKHMNPLNNSIMGTGNGFKCRDCHARTIAGFSNLSVTNKGKHVNAFLDFSGQKSGKNHNGITKVCSNVYCHSNGNPNAIQYASMAGAMAWNGAGTITTCNQCHGTSNAIGYPDYANGGASTATSNLHFGHMSSMSTNTNTTGCSDCHRKTAETAVPNRFRPYSTTHLSGGPNVVFNKTKTNIGNNATVVINGANNWTVTCSSVVCHGSGAPVWGNKKAGSGNARVRTCTKCHGDSTAADYLTNYSSATIAPGANGVGTDTSMVNSAATSPRVGAHQRHLLTDMISNAIKCGECHVPVTNVRNASHWNMTTATLSFNGRARAGGEAPFVTRTAQGIMQCTNTYCHTGKYNSGTVQIPFWNMTGLVKESASTVGACNKCHAMPPSGYGNHPAALSDAAALSTIVGSCQSCHNNISPSATNMSNAFVDKNLHVNGVINYITACDSCHDYNVRTGNTWGKLSMAGANTEGYGAHVKHIQYLQARYPTFSSLKPGADNWASANFIKICGACHSTNEASAHSLDKALNKRQLTFPGTGSFGSATFYNGSSLSSSTAKPKTCSNLDCHYRTSPIWSTY
jgi:predicted CxxxxCH...CXXCH cytochrome family protein